jgi:hypothetical protein
VKSEPRAGELREWISTTGRHGTFIVVDVEGYRVDVILSDGKKDGFFRPYLQRNSRVVMETKE